MNAHDIKYVEEQSKSIMPDANNVCTYCHNGKRNGIGSRYVCPVCYITVEKLN